MYHFSVQTLSFPCLITPDHLLPSGKRTLRGNGIIFTQTIRDAMRQNGLWLVMQESDGQIAMARGDIVSQAKVLAVDWLTAGEICAEIEISGWGEVVTSRHFQGYGQLTARAKPLWDSVPPLEQEDILVIRLKQWLADEYRNAGEFSIPSDILNPGQLCCFWLERLPLSLAIKQRLLRQPEPSICLRYLKKIIRQSDRFSSHLR